MKKNDLWIEMEAKTCGHKIKTDSPFAIVYYCNECSENNKFRRYGFELCKMNGECDFCDSKAEQKDYFWRSSSSEIIEGDYYCRKCVKKEINNVENFDIELFINMVKFNKGE